MSSGLPRDAFLRADGTEILPTDPDALRVLVKLGIIEVVQDSEDEGEVIYRMPDRERVARALAMWDLATS